MNDNNYKDQIVYLITKLWILVTLWVIFMAAEAFFGWREYQSFRKILPIESGIDLNLEAFNQLWQVLNKRIIPVELDKEIRYVESRGKLEPFE